MEIADYIIVISGGKVSAEGSREEILPGLLKENSSRSYVLFLVKHTGVLPDKEAVYTVVARTREQRLRRQTVLGKH